MVTAGSEAPDRETRLLTVLIDKTAAGAIKWRQTDLPEAYLWCGDAACLVIERQGFASHRLRITKDGDEIDSIVSIAEYRDELAELWTAAGKTAGAGDRLIDALLEELG